MQVCVVMEGKDFKYDTATARRLHFGKQIYVLTTKENSTDYGRSLKSREHVM